MMRIRSAGRALAAAAVSVGLLVAAPGIANADGDWTWTNGFEGDPSQTWEFDWGGNFEINSGMARSGSNSAYLPTNDDFVSVRTTLAIPSWMFRGSGYNCEATAWVHALTNDDGYNVSDINFEIIDEPSWTYMALMNYKVQVGSGWTKIKTPYWSDGDEHPALRVSLLKDSAPLLVDDVEVSCYNWVLL